MAKLPDPDQLTRTVPTSGQRIVSYDAGIMGRGIEQLGQGLTSAGGSFLHIAAVEKKRIDKLKVDEAFNSLQEELINLRVGENGFKRVQGGDAVKEDFTPTYKGKLQTSVTALSESLANEEQRQAFKSKAQNASLAFDYDLMNHSLAESEAYGVQVLEGVKQTAIKNIRLNWNDPAIIAAETSRLKEQAQAHYEGTGQPQELQDLFVEDALMRAHSGVVLQAIEANDFEAAQKHLDDNKDLLGPAEVAKMQTKIDSDQTEYLAQQVYDAPGFDELDYKDQLEIVAEIKDEKVQSIARSVLGQRRTLAEAAKTEGQYQVYQGLWDKGMAKNLTRTEIMRSGLETGQKEHLLSMIGEGGGDKSTSPENLLKWWNARQKIVGGEWTEKDIMNAALSGEVYGGHAQGLVKFVQENREAPSLGRAETVLSERYAKIYKDDADKAKYIDLLNRDVQQFRQVEKREPSYDEVLQIGDRIAKPDQEKFWYQFWKHPKAPYQQDAPQGLYDSMAHDMRQTGWPDAYWDDESKVFVLGNKDGYAHVQLPGGKRLKRKVKND